MTDKRTPEQKAADDNLLEAITRVVNLQERDEDSVDQGEQVVAEFIVAARVDSFALMDAGRAAYAYVTKDSGHGPHAMPHHACVGLIEMAKEWYRA